MLLQKEVKEFLNIAPIILPELFGDARIGETDYQDDIAVIPIVTTRKFDLEDIMDFLEDQMEMTILYHFMPSANITCGHQCCAYSDIKFGHMFKIHAVTNDAGFVDCLTVTVFSSLEVMATNLMSDLDKHEEIGRFRYSRSKYELLVEFQ